MFFKRIRIRADYTLLILSLLHNLSLFAVVLTSEVVVRFGNLFDILALRSHAGFKVVLLIKVSYQVQFNSVMHI